jgi:hypothetical protein
MDHLARHAILYQRGVGQFGLRRVTPEDEDARGAWSVEMLSNLVVQIL